MKDNELWRAQVAKGGARHKVLVNLAAPVYAAVEAAALERGVPVSVWLALVAVEVLQVPAARRGAK